MKELTIEQKAKRYDEVIEIARKIKNGEPINVPNGTVISDVIFSELKESKDEKKDFPNEIWRCLSKEDIIAWIEKHANKNRTSMTEIEIKLEIFKAIANNSLNLCPASKYIPPKGIAVYTNEVYEILTKTSNSNN